jgi:hypothetical protein
VGIHILGPINLQTKRSGKIYIITVKNYSTKWVEESLVIDCIENNTVWFIFEKIVTRFGCMCIFLSDQGTHFLNTTIATLTEEF